MWQRSAAQQRHVVPSVPRSSAAVSPSTISAACPGRRVSHTVVRMPAAASSGATSAAYNRRARRRPDAGLSSTSRLLWFEMDGWQQYFWGHEAGPASPARPADAPLHASNRRPTDAHLGRLAAVASTPALMAAAQSATPCSSPASSSTRRSAHSHRRRGERRKVSTSRQCARSASRRQGRQEAAVEGARGGGRCTASISLKGTACAAAHAAGAAAAAGWRPAGSHSRPVLVRRTWAGCPSTRSSCGGWPGSEARPPRPASSASSTLALEGGVGGDRDGNGSGGGGGGERWRRRAAAATAAA